MKINNKIPNGIYCYDENGLCPHWMIVPGEEQNNGYCAYMDIGDWNLDFGLLWDQVKECCENDDDDELYDELLICSG